MRKMKDSGVAWIGEIPEKWDVSSFKHSGKFYKGKLPTSTNVEAKGSPIIGASEMLGKECRMYTEDTNLPTCTKEDILILWDGANAGIVANGQTGVVSSTTVNYTISAKNLDKEFVFLQFKALEPFFKNKVNGTTIPHMNMKFINDSPLLLPSKAEQVRIAEFLDKKCGEIDSLISLQEEMISELQAYKQSVITEAVTKGLDKNVKMKDSGVAWIGKIPEGWKLLKTMYVLSGLQDGTHGSFERVNVGYPLLSAKNVFEDGIHIDNKDSFISKSDFEKITSNGFPSKGDIVMCCVGSIGRCCIYCYDTPIAFQRSVTFMRTNEYTIPEYFIYYLRSVSFQSQLNMNAKTSAQSGIYLGDIANTIVVLPTIEDQRAIADYLDSKTSQIDALISIKQEKIEELKEYKKSIIYEYVTGKKEVI